MVMGSILVLGGVGFTVKEVVETARKVTGHPIPAKEEPRRAGDPSMLIASSAKAREVLGWNPQYADLGLSIAHYDLRFLKPLDEELLHEAGRKFQRILTIEDGIIKGGMGSAVLEFMADNEYKPTVKRIGIPNIFVEHGAVAELYQLCGMDEEGILTKIKEFIN